jgi:peroxiredoxin
MSQVPDMYKLPPDLPVPTDDGAADHLIGMCMPDVSLRETTGRTRDMPTLEDRVVIYCYPMTGQPGVAMPEGWDEIPGARGCTPQSCAFGDHHQELRDLGAEVFGLSTQTTEYQRQMAERLHLPFPVLSDSDYQFTDALRLPTFEVEGKRLLKRLTLIVTRGVIENVNYPVFPPDQDPDNVIAWLHANPAS